jgi:hypothetical protein
MSRRRLGLTVPPIPAGDFTPAPVGLVSGRVSREEGELPPVPGEEGGEGEDEGSGAATLALPGVVASSCPTLVSMVRATCGPLTATPASAVGSGGASRSGSGAIFMYYGSTTGTQKQKRVSATGQESHHVMGRGAKLKNPGPQARTWGRCVLLERSMRLPHR